MLADHRTPKKSAMWSQAEGGLRGFPTAKGGIMNTTTRLSIASAIVLFLLPFAWSQGSPSYHSEALAQETEQESQVTVPNRLPNHLYKGEQGPQRSEIEFAPSTRTATIKFLVQDPNGYFLPNIRRDNFAVYEDGVRQKEISVDVEHSPVSLAVLAEYGGRYHELNQTLATEVKQVGRDLLGVLTPDDKVAIFKYDSKVDTLVDFTQNRDAIEKALDQLGDLAISESNFYDALLETLNRTHDFKGRKAIIVVSSGLDTFSKASFQQVLEAAQKSDTPIYIIGLSGIAKREASLHGETAPFARIDWKNAEKQLETLAKASGGRAYVIESDLEIPPIYDDIMENLRVRYVITYVSSNPATSGPPRSIRIELIDPKTGAPLKIHDASGKVVAARVYVQASYVTKAAPGS
jgi:VWFA-related protein